MGLSTFAHASAFIYPGIRSASFSYLSTSSAPRRGFSEFRFKSSLNSLSNPLKNTKFMKANEVKDFLHKDVNYRFTKAAPPELEVKIRNHVEIFQKLVRPPSLPSARNVRTFYQTLHDRLGPDYLTNFINVVSNDPDFFNKDLDRVTKALSSILFNDLVLVNQLVNTELQDFVPISPACAIRQANLVNPKLHWLPVGPRPFDKYKDPEISNEPLDTRQLREAFDRYVPNLEARDYISSYLPDYHKPMVFRQQKIKNMRQLTNLVYLTFDEYKDEDLGVEFIQDFLRALGLTGCVKIFLRPKYHRIDSAQEEYNGEPMGEDKVMQADDEDDNSIDNLQYLTQDPPFTDCSGVRKPITSQRSHRITPKPAFSDDENEYDTTIDELELTPVFAYLVFDGHESKSKAISASFASFGSYFRDHRFKMMDADLHKKLYVMNFVEPFVPDQFLDYLNPLQEEIAEKFSLPVNPFSCPVKYLGFKSTISYCILKTNSLMEARLLRESINSHFYDGHPLLCELEANGPNLEF